jgi:general secretion pathway protein G
MEKNRNRRDRRSGFTLVELLVVMVILGLLASIALPAVFNQAEKARVGTAKTNIAALGAALDAYALDVGSYPSDLDSLVRAPAGAQRWDGPYLKKKQIPKDPWGNEFEYKTPNSGEYELSSRGPDGNSGGGDDISSSD